VAFFVHQHVQLHGALDALAEGYGRVLERLLLLDHRGHDARVAEVHQGAGPERGLGGWGKRGRGGPRLLGVLDLLGLLGLLGLALLLGQAGLLGLLLLLQSLALLLGLLLLLGAGLLGCVLLGLGHGRRVRVLASGLGLGFQLLLRVLGRLGLGG